MKVLNPAQEEQLKEIGAQLREVRLEQGLSIDEIAAKTLIRVTFIQALEEGQLDLLPEAIFVQGFIRRYGDVLGLDGTALGKTFPTDFSLPKSDMDTDTKSRGISIPLYIPYILLLIAATCGLSYLLNSQRGTQTVQQPVATSKPIPVKSTPTIPLVSKPSQAALQPVAAVIPKTTQATPASTPAVPTPLTQATPKPNSPIKVTVNLQDSSWVRVTVDGKKEFEGTLPKEKQQTWTASKSLTFRTGNAGAVMLSLNEQQAQLLGSVGAVKEVTFTPENTSPDVNQPTSLPATR